MRIKIPMHRYPHDAACRNNDEPTVCVIKELQIRNRHKMPPHGQNPCSGIRFYDNARIIS